MRDLFMHKDLLPAHTVGSHGVDVCKKQEGTTPEANQNASSPSPTSGTPDPVAYFPLTGTAERATAGGDAGTVGLRGMPGWEL
jgi:hypothetical protein